MYLGYYGLRKDPFHITPDPKFLYPSPSHKEALATILYGVEKRKGFIEITGEVGTGKTTVLRDFASQQRGSRVRTIYILDPYLTFDELLHVLLEEMEIDAGDAGPARKLARIQEALIEEFRQGRVVVLLIDEAQHMPVETLERLRMLSNLETTEEKLLQIVLIGQPELDEKLGLHSLRQLRDRIAVKSVIRPLTPKESAEYIDYRINAAWGTCAEVFSKAAIRRIVRHAKGVPRTINIVCDNVLIAGFGAQMKPIKPAIVDEVIRDLDRTPKGRRSRRAMAVTACVCLLLLVPILGLLWNEMGHWVPNLADAATLEEASAPVSNELGAVSPVLKAQPPPVREEVELAPELAGSEAALPEPITEAATPAVDLRPSEASAPIVEVPQEMAPPAGSSVTPLAQPSVIERAPMVDGPLSILVEPGDCLSALAAGTYGASSPELLQRIKELNPMIKHEDHLEPGQVLVFPHVPETVATEAGMP